MSDFILNNEKLLLDFIKEGNIASSDLPKFYEAVFCKHGNKVKTEFILSLKKFPDFISKNLLSKYLNISTNNINEIINNDVSSAYFPVSNANETEICKVYIIQSEKFAKSFTFSGASKEILKSIEIIENYFNKKFLIMFDNDFIGKSFMLSVAAVLMLNNNILNKFAFTGSFTSKGKIEKAGYLPEKKEICKRNNLKLIYSENIDEIKDLNLLLIDELSLPFVVLFGKQKSFLNNNFQILEKFNDLKNFRKIIKIFGLTIDDLSVFSEQFLPNNNTVWDKFLKEFVNKVSYLFNNFGNINFHLTGSLATFSFAMGIIMGAKRKTCLYHFQNGNFYNVIDLKNNSSRIIKSKTNNYEYIKFKDTLFEDSNELSIIIYLASHNPINDTLNFINNNGNSNVLIIESINNQGNISIYTNWAAIVSEIYSAIDNFQNEHKIKITKYNFFMSTPIPIAMAVGMAIGDYKEISIFQYEKTAQTYIEVLNSNKSEYLKNFF